jgi:hypothetical protein
MHFSSKTAIHILFYILLVKVKCNSIFVFLSKHQTKKACRWLERIRQPLYEVRDSRSDEDANCGCNDCKSLPPLS